MADTDTIPATRPLSFTSADLPRRTRHGADSTADLANPGGKWCADILANEDDDLARVYTLAAISCLVNGRSLAYLAGIRHLSHTYESRSKLRPALAARGALLATVDGSR